MSAAAHDRHWRLLSARRHYNEGDGRVRPRTGSRTLSHTMDDDVVRIPVEDAIDLHVFAPRDIVAVVDEYLLTAQEAGFEMVRLIHGRGKGVQRAAIQR